MVNVKSGLAPPSRLWRIAAYTFAACLLVRFACSFAALPVSAYILKPLGQPYADAARTLPGDRISGRHLMIVNSPNTLAPLLIWSARQLAAQALPARVRVLADCGLPVEIFRHDASTLRVRMRGGLFSGYMSRLFRDPELEPITAGQVLRLTGMTVRVTRSGAAGPEEVEYQFDYPLEDPSYCWIQWRDRAYIPFTPPAPGSSVQLPGFSVTDLLSR